MHLFPQLIRPERVPASPAPARELFGLSLGSFGTATFQGIEIGLPMEVGDSAVTAEAALSSARTGALLVERLVRLGVDLIAQLIAHGWNDPEQTASEPSRSGGPAEQTC